ncbi:tail fiber domain-containing protein [Klebsiella aerogenes]
MTVSTEVDHNDYTGNGVTTSFPYTFRIFQKSDLMVQVVNLNENITVLTLDTDYTVTGAGGYSGGAVVLASPLENGWQISISRDLPVTQEIDLRNQGKFFAEVHEDAFDKLTMLIQQCFGFLRLALRKPSFIANYYDALNNRIRNLRDPSQAQDAATKKYVDSSIVDNTNAWKAGDAALNQKIDANFSRTIRVPEATVAEVTNNLARRNSLFGWDSNGNPVPIFGMTDTADLAIKLASHDKGLGGDLVGTPQGGTVNDLANSVYQTSVSRITDHGIGFANWPQGKAVTFNNNLYVGYNYATAHGSVVQDAMVISSHNGLDWAAPVMIAQHNSTESASAWSLGYNAAANKLIALVRFRAGGGDTSAMRYEAYESSNSGVSWSKVADINIKSTTGYDAVELHGFCLDSQGRYITGYHSIDGELGYLAINTDNYTFQRIVLMNAADNFNGTLIQCELNFLYSSGRNEILVTARSQDISKGYPKAWVIDATTLAVKRGPTTTPFAQSVNPVSPVYSPDFSEVWFVYANRYDATNVSSQQAGIWVSRTSLNDAFDLIFSSAKTYMLCQASGALSTSAAVAGAQHACLFGNRIVIPFAARVEHNSDRSDVFVATVDMDADRTRLGAARYNPVNTMASTANQKVEQRYYGVGPYQARIRMNGLNLVNDNTDLFSFDFGFSNYNNGYRNFRFFTGSATPTLYIASGQSVAGSAKIDLNASTQFYGTDHHLRPSSRLRINSTIDIPGPSVLYYDPALGFIQVGSMASAVPIPTAIVGNVVTTSITYRNVASVSAGHALRNLGDTESTQTLLRGSGSTGFSVDISGISNAMTIAPTTGATTFHGEVNAPAFNPTSDRTLKSNFSDIYQALIAVAKAVKPQQYTLNGDSEQRIRTGFIAQDIIAEMEANGLDWRDYSLVVENTVVQETEEGVTTSTYYSVDYMQMLLLRSL